MSEKETEAGAPKRQKLSHEMEQGPNQLSIAGPSNEQPPPKIFKLDVDCFDEIFEYLSLRDLNSFALTCKTIHKVTGEFFKRNYSDSELRIKGYRLKLDRFNGDLTFNQFVSKLTLEGFNRNSIYSPEALLYVALHPNEFKSINKLTLDMVQVDTMTVDVIKSYFSKLESLKIAGTMVRVNLYDAILKFCTNLKRLQLDKIPYEFDEDEEITDSDSWIRQKYPKLTHFWLSMIPSIHDLDIFFQNNPSIKVFNTLAEEILSHQNEIINLKVQLDVFKVYINNEDYVNIPFFELLNQLHEQKVYKRLGIFVITQNYTEMFFDKLQVCLPLLRGLKQLRICAGFEIPDLSSLPDLPNLNALEIEWGSGRLKTNLIAKKFVNLERLYIEYARFETVLSCIQGLPELKMLKLGPHAKTKNLKLITLNKERIKLLGAHKVTIYVPDSVFLYSKWKIGNGNTNLQMIEMKRFASCPWDNDYNWSCLNSKN